MVDIRTSRSLIHAHNKPTPSIASTAALFIRDHPAAIVSPRNTPQLGSVTNQAASRPETTLLGPVFPHSAVLSSSILRSAIRRLLRASTSRPLPLGLL